MPELNAIGPPKILIFENGEAVLIKPCRKIEKRNFQLPFLHINFKKLAMNFGNDFAVSKLIFNPQKLLSENHFISFTRKYPLSGYILGVLTHTTAWDRHWGVDETLKLVLVYVA